jgi:hypothetical protein
MSGTSLKLGALVLPAAAASLAVLGLGAGDAHTADPDAPMTCRIAVTKSGFGHTYEGEIHARTTIEGQYELTLTGRGGGSTRISQSGDFLVRAGETEVIGQATLGGTAARNVEAELTLRVGGRTYVCGAGDKTTEL